MRLARQINLAFVSTLLLVVSLVGALTYVSVARGFQQYVRGLESARLEPATHRLLLVHAKEGGWASLRHDPRRFGELLRREDGEREAPRDDHDGPPRVDDRRPPRDPRGPRPDGERPPPGADRPPPDDYPRGPSGEAPRDFDPLELPPRVTLYDADGTRLIGSGTPATDGTRIPLLLDGPDGLDGRAVGYLGVQPIEQLEQQLDVSYLRTVRSELAIIAAAALVLGLLSGALLTRRIVRPVLALAAGTRSLIAGDYHARVGQHSRDELGQLSRDFDALAGSLEESARARKQWVADTSHELRTPVTVLRAELEAMLDGIRPVDREGIASLHAEVSRLSRLVDSLGELARSDRGDLDLSMSDVAPVPALLETLSGFRGRLSRRGISLQLDLTSARAALVRGDTDRLQQVFANLLENATRYVETDGTLRISAALQGSVLQIAFDDSGPGVDATALPRLFDRLYRADPSRSSEHGGSGLGLSICQRLVSAHGGTVRAARSPLGGLQIEMEFPLAPAT
jgi:two-component system, OmpR family, sensor histidine kinase BaeS